MLSLLELGQPPLLPWDMGGLGSRAVRLRLALTPLARLWPQTELLHQLSWFSRLQMADGETSGPP